MSVGQRRSAIDRPSCLACGDPAFAVVVSPHADAMPYCYDCGTDEVSYGGVEYPLEEFYELDGSRVGQIAHEGVVQLFDPDNSDGGWIEADTHRSSVSYTLTDWI